MRRHLALVALLLGLLAVAAPSTFAAGPKKDNDTHLQLLAINDFHGNLEPPTGSSGRIAISPTVNVDAGGAEYLATHLKTLEQQNPNTLEVGAGDLIGASPLLSGLFHDEPTIEAMNAMGMDVTGVGNHEFDAGVDELLRMQNGGCNAVDGCAFDAHFAGGTFKYLAANVYDRRTNNRIFPPYELVDVGGVTIAFLGLATTGTPFTTI